MSELDPFFNDEALVKGITKDSKRLRPVGTVCVMPKYTSAIVNEYRHRLSTATHEIYDLWRVANDDWDRTDDLHSIAVDISTNTWEDYGDATPNIVVENADGTVSVCHDTATDIKYKFVKPTSASWL